MSGLWESPFGSAALNLVRVGSVPFLKLALQRVLFSNLRFYLCCLKVIIYGRYAPVRAVTHFVTLL